MTKLKKIFAVILTVAMMFSASAGMVDAAGKSRTGKPIPHSSGGAVTHPYKVTLTNQATNTDGEFIKGAVYTITMTEGGYDPATQSYKAAEGELASGVDITIGDDNSSLGAPYKFESTADGIIFYLPEGSYNIVQKKAAEGYYLDKNVIKIHLPATSADGTTLKNELEINPKQIKILKKVTFEKQDGDDAGTKVKGAVFKVKRSTDSTDGTDGTFEDYLRESYTTNAEGKIVLENAPHGWYTFEEIEAPRGYSLSKEVYKVEVKEEDTGDSGEQETEITVTGTNYKQPLPDKSIEIGEGVSGTGTDSDPYIYNPGDAIPYKLKVKLAGDAGQYTKFQIVDTLPDALKVLDTSDIVVKLDGTDSTNLFTVSATENSINVSPTSISSLTGHNEVSVEFNATIKAGRLGETIQNKFHVDYTNKWDVEESVETPDVTTPDEDGTPKKPVAPPHIYAPDNGITITKIDGTTNEELEGVKFQLYYQGESSDVAIGKEETTNEEGKITWTGLRNGTYKLVETQTKTVPEGEVGYRLLDKPIIIEINNTSATTGAIDQTVKNYKTNVWIPKTGTLGYIPYLLVGMALLGGAWFFLFKKKEEDKEEETAK